MSAIILINPHAAGGRARKLHPLIQKWCKSHSTVRQDTGIVMPESIQEALLVLQNVPFGSRIIVVGGDGTLNQMLPGLIHRNFQVGLVPYGSGNDCARAWGLHKMNWQEALAFALKEDTKPTDLGQIKLPDHSLHYFHSSLALGFDASVGNKALEGPKFLTGLLRYLVATFRELSALKNWPVRIDLDGKHFTEGSCLLASTLNTSTYGGGMPAVPNAQIEDGELNLLVAGNFDRLQTLLMLPRLLVGWHLGHSRIQTQSFQNADLSSPIDLPIAADGETLGYTRQLRIEVLPGALQAVRI
jgi:YegS/Rv2252/BmrU family lipid kinase